MSSTGSHVVPFRSLLLHVVGAANRRPLAGCRAVNRKDYGNVSEARCMMGIKISVWRLVELQKQADYGNRKVLEFPGLLKDLKSRIFSR